jgi:hypothetical protein
VISDQNCEISRKEGNILYSFQLEYFLSYLSIKLCKYNPSNIRKKKCKKGRHSLHMIQKFSYAVKLSFVSLGLGVELWSILQDQSCFYHRKHFSLPLFFKSYFFLKRSKKEEKSCGGAKKNE